MSEPDRSTAIMLRFQAFAREVDGTVEVVEHDTGNILLRLSLAAAEDMLPQIEMAAAQGRRKASLNGRCPHCNDEGVVHDMAGNVLGPCGCVDPTSCPCGWRAESPDTHPHVAGCPHDKESRDGKA